MALINKLNDIANAIRNKNGKTNKMTLGEMASAINNLKTSFITQNKTITPTENEQIIECDTNYDGLGSVKVNAISNTYVGTNVTRQSAKTITPTKSKQTACASEVYTIGTISVDPIPNDYIIPSGSDTKTQNGTYDVTSLAQVIVSVAGGGGGLPSGISALDFGTYTKNDATTTTKFTISHNLGVVPDLVIFYTPTNIATTYTMLCAIRGNIFGWRSSAYNSWYAYHGNSTTTASMTNSNNASYGISNMTSSSFQVQSNSTSYYWRAGTYQWIAIKF